MLYCPKNFENWKSKRRKKKNKRIDPSTLKKKRKWRNTKNSLIFFRSRWSESKENWQREKKRTKRRKENRNICQMYTTIKGRSLAGSKIALIKAWTFRALLPNSEIKKLPFPRYEIPFLNSSVLIFHSNWELVITSDFKFIAYKIIPHHLNKLKILWSFFFPPGQAIPGRNRTFRELIVSLEFNCWPSPFQFFWRLRIHTKQEFDAPQSLFVGNLSWRWKVSGLVDQGSILSK